MHYRQAYNLLYASYTIFEFFIKCHMYDIEKFNLIYGDLLNTDLKIRMTVYYSSASLSRTKYTYLVNNIKNLLSALKPDGDTTIKDGKEYKEFGGGETEL